MQTLEHELHFITTLPANKRPKNSFQKLTQLIQTLNENATQVNDLSTALTYLEQAEHWSTSLEPFQRSGRDKERKVGGGGGDSTGAVAAPHQPRQRSSSSPPVVASYNPSH